MKFKVDENLPMEVAVALREAGHDAMSVVDQGLGGRADASVAEVCRREGRSLVTLDVDFANVQAYPPRDYAGLLVLRLASRVLGRQLSLDGLGQGARARAHRQCRLSQN
jgi:predicted nuclease of predicted toxin-antitoxin system